MRKIKLAVILDQVVTSGGGFQQSLNAILLVNKLERDVLDIVFFTTIKENINILSKHGITFQYLNINLLDKLCSYIKSKFNHSRVLNFLKSIIGYSKFEKFMIDYDIDLIYFTSPSSLAKEIDKLNFILTVWDLNYLNNNEFPEYRNNKIIDTLHQYYKLTIKKATAVIVDSEELKNNVIKNYSINKDSVNIIPFEPSQFIKNFLSNPPPNEIDIKKKYNIKYPYVFYPAQFWAHKNHIYIIHGIKILKEKFNIKISALFSGGDQGNISFLKNQVKNLKLEKQIHFVGFVDNEEIPIIYRQALALVMPTFFGPTNIPPLEAFSMGVPVLYSDLKGLRDQVGDAALLLDLKNPDVMANHINNLIKNKNFRESTIKKGYERFAYFKNINRKKILVKIINEYKMKLSSWKI